MFSSQKKKTIQIIKAICLDSNRLVACIRPANPNNQWTLPGGITYNGEGPADTLERTLKGLYDGELSIGSELCRTNLTQNGTRYRVTTYICYPTNIINHLPDGTELLWLSQADMANHVWSNIDQKAADRVMSPLFGESEYRTKKAIQEHALDAINLTLGEIDSDNTKNPNNKGYPGNVIEQVWFNHPADNISAPDFPEAGVELKVTPIDFKKTKTGEIEFKAGERLVLNIINYKNEEKSTFTTSSFWNKNKYIEIIQYLRRDVSKKKETEDKLRYKVKYANLLALEDINEPDFPQDNLIRLSDKHMVEIEEDWTRIHKLIKQGRANELTESMTRTLGTCTKGNSDYRFTVQSNGQQAKSRAYCFKQGFMTTLLQEYILKDTTLQSLIHDTKALTYKTTEEIILDYFNPYRGQTLNDIAKSFNLNWPLNKTPKNIVYLLVKRMLNINSPDTTADTDAGLNSMNVEEFSNDQIRIKTITLFHGAPKENFKVQGISDFFHLSSQHWEDSDLYKLLETQRFLLLVFDNNNNNSKDSNPSGIQFLGAKFWNVPEKDLNGMIKSVWEEDVSKIRNGVHLIYAGGKVHNNFVKESDERILHLRPDAAKSQYCPPYQIEYDDANGKHHKKTINNARQLPAPASWENRPSNHDMYTENYMTKQAWWLNQKYMFSQIEELLPKTA
ncbi:putative type II restriction enzyme Sau3AI [Bifidobacterium saguini DSM 23967]|uniref:DNA mismatch repair MutH/Type II restriction enzyme Sau3AI domain-containing protein n=2 Tax=Bifidobacterium saguini TaxID=762210 RepID=A0ABX7SEW9_9BIFI|nr:Sau3AI family type II restriction endonuclease [Bifidobacterium saguini]KFI91669.1 putative type II restriction enzyme Sau3AI [Bifidobacterium saguini DSM 23967]QTB91892.1 hypothetical protein BSD967_05770 [Bifidobacterium saguini]